VTDLEATRGREEDWLDQIEVILRKARRRSQLLAVRIAVFGLLLFVTARLLDWLTVSVMVTAVNEYAGRAGAVASFFGITPGFQVIRNQSKLEQIRQIRLILSRSTPDERQLHRDRIWKFLLETTYGA
jgi:hypothetical protein